MVTPTEDCELVTPKTVNSELVTPELLLVRDLKANGRNGAEGDWPRHLERRAGARHAVRGVGDGLPQRAQAAWRQEEALLRQVQAGWREEAADAAWIIFGHCLGGGLQVRLLLGDEGRAA